MVAPRLVLEAANQYLLPAELPFGPTELSVLIPEIRVALGPDGSQPVCVEEFELGISHGAELVQTDAQRAEGPTKTTERNKNKKFLLTFFMTYFPSPEVG